MVTSGATEALAGALLALIEPGDEVVLFAPMYDAYLPLVPPRRRRAAVRDAAAARWRLDEAALAAAFATATRVVVLNNPLNPSATPVRAATTSTLLAAFCVRYDVIALCDEVWEHVVFDGAPPPAADGAARHARAHREDRLGGQDLLPHRLEGRLRHGRRPR